MQRTKGGVTPRGVASYQHQEEQSVTTPAAVGEGTLRSFICVSVAEQINGGKNALDVEPLKYHCSVLVMVPKKAAKGQCVRLAVLDIGSRMLLCWTEAWVCS